MTKTSAPQLTQRTTRASSSDKSQTSQSKYDENPSGVTIGLAISMAWQLAVIVLVPILVGHALDAHFNRSPLFTVIGMALAMIGMIVVVKQTLRQLNQSMSSAAKEQHDK